MGFMRALDWFPSSPLPVPPPRLPLTSELPSTLRPHGNLSRRRPSTTETNPTPSWCPETLPSKPGSLLRPHLPRLEPLPTRPLLRPPLSAPLETLPPRTPLMPTLLSLALTLPRLLLRVSGPVPLLPLLLLPRRTLLLLHLPELLRLPPRPPTIPLLPRPVLPTSPPPRLPRRLPRPPRRPASPLLLPTVPGPLLILPPRVPPPLPLTLLLLPPSPEPLPSLPIRTTPTLSRKDTLTDSSTDQS